LKAASKAYPLPSEKTFIAAIALMRPVMAREEAFFLTRRVTRK
jgi:hypothetical protein